MKPLDLIILLLTIFLSACQDKQKEIITLLVKEWQGKQILFPENMVFTRFASDTTNFVIPTSDYKVLVFVDSIGCTSCKLQLSRWKEFIRYTDSISQKNIPFLFFFQFDDQWEIHSLLIRENFDKPICLDRSDSLNQLNHFPKDIRFQVFLLDKNNKVVVIGNPVHNPNVKELYLEEISRKQPVAPIQTTVKVEKESLLLETIPLGKSKDTLSTLVNTGDQPLVIIDVTTTCGCAQTLFDKHPVQPGESLHIKVGVTPENKGLFDETITVKCNTNQLIKLNIRGNTI
ncbi:DUF1573 domain-containing protein [Parabacteroides sp. merdae-related_45_40]|jgi:hypothetical protein|uniref:DUF1573 domain-containing protein n=1 Tax=Parabacteroides sp. merdae-related_45_40 TaxID=1897013 RepID=UPI00096559D6|nr:DUF1573 domain-containing protein [Parabacteroides sp. merdae-related_45_40]OKZ33236.1 MAG: hypothetical protein BHV83_05720 [Parabacteroides sp. merdae-related_45_40]